MCRYRWFIDDESNKSCFQLQTCTIYNVQSALLHVLGTFNHINWVSQLQLPAPIDLLLIRDTHDIMTIANQPDKYEKKIFVIASYWALGKM